MPPIDWNAVVRDLNAYLARALLDSPASTQLLVGMGVLERVEQDAAQTVPVITGDLR